MEVKREGRKKKEGENWGKAELLERERSWSLGSGRNIDEFFKRKRKIEKVEKEKGEGDSCKKNNKSAKSPEKIEGVEKSC